MTLDEAMAVLPPIKLMREAIREERERIMTEHRHDRSWRKQYPFARNRGPSLIALDARGERLNDIGTHEWRGTKKSVATLLAKFPDCDEIFYDGGVDFAPTMDGFDNGNYEPEFFQATLYKKSLGARTLSSLIDIR